MTNLNNPIEVLRDVINVFQSLFPYTVDGVTHEWPPDLQDGRYQEMELTITNAIFALERWEAETHTIRVSAGGWVVRHPLSCRADDLFYCSVNEWLEEHPPTHVPLGMHPMVQVDGEWRFSNA